MKKIFETKAAISKQITDIDLSKRKVSGYFASFGNVDAHNEIILKGAFAKSIQERGPKSAGNRKIAHLYQHKMNDPRGVLLELEEDDFGLKFVSEIVKTQAGDDLLVLYESGAIREHSVGFSYIWDKTDYDKATGALVLKELKLWEGSSVTFGANEETPFLGVKSVEDISAYIEALNKDFDAWMKVIKSKASDETCELAEFNLLCTHKKINDLVNTLSEKAVHLNTFDKPKPNDSESNFFNLLLK